MAERLQVTRSWLSRYLKLAKLPPEVLAAYGTPHALGISHAARLAPLLRVPATRTRVFDAAQAIVLEQRLRTAKARPAIGAAEVTRRLTEIVKPARKAPRRAEARDTTGRLIAKAERGRGGAVTIVIARPDSVDGADLLNGIKGMLERLSP